MKYINISSIIVIIFFLISGCQTKTQTENLTSANNWTAFQDGTGKHTNAQDIFEFNNDAINLYGKKAGYLISNKSYSSFILKAEFKWNTDTCVIRKSNKPNSGLMYMVPDTITDKLWPAGIQYQIKKGATGDFILLGSVTININGQETIAGKSVASKRFNDAAKPFGEWNSIEIICKNDSITQKLNNVIVNQGTSPSTKSGRILLQYEGFPIDFKDIEITAYN
jgi:hypothetical protein